MPGELLMSELKQARGELKRLRTDLVKFRAEGRHRMKKLENIVETGTITLVEKEQIEKGDFGEPEVKRPKINEQNKKSSDNQFGWECIGFAIFVSIFVSF